MNIDKSEIQKKVEADALYLRNCQNILERSDEKIFLTAVRKDGNALPYVTYPTYDICLEAILQKPLAVKFLQDFVDEGKITEKERDSLFLEAVQKDWRTIRFIPLTDTICIEAVRQNPFSLLFINDEFQTPELCIMAVRQDGDIVEWIDKDILKKDKNLEICIAAVKQNGKALQYLDSIQLDPELDKEAIHNLCLEAVRNTWRALYYVRELTSDILAEALKQNIESISALKNMSMEICMLAVRINPLAIRYIPSDMKTEALCLEVVKHNGLFLQFIENPTEAVCVAALKQNIDSFEYVNKENKAKLLKKMVSML